MLLDCFSNSFSNLSYFNRLIAPSKRVDVDCYHSVETIDANSNRNLIYLRMRFEQQD